MLDVLSKLTHKEEKQLIATSGHYVTDLDLIIHLLNQARHTRTLLTATFPENPHRYATAVLGVYEEYDLLVLDELIPRRGHDQLLEHGKIELSGFMEGVDLRFKTELIEARSQDGVAFYKVVIPDRLYYLQRRSDHRVPPGMSGMPFQGYRGKQAQQLLRGYLFDVSRNGVGIILQGVATLRPGEVLSGCTLPLPNGEIMTFSLEVRFVSKNKRRSVTRLGGRFKEVEKATLRKIRQMVNKLERDEAKRLRE
ncbi:MAG: flagellar regulator YcgR PilZN domain-containing protein [Candidatus Sedimenticola sp. (ex Thyasira tokunagai)]